MQVLLRLLVFVHGHIDLPLQAFEFIFVVNDLPELFLLQHGLKLINLLLKPFLVVVDILVHFPLSVDEHVARELLYSRHH